MSFVCPNGHEFPAMRTVPCPDCDALVVVEPVAAGMRLHELLEAAEADLARERFARQATDQALQDAIRERDEARRELDRLR